MGLFTISKILIRKYKNFQVKISANIFLTLHYLKEKFWESWQEQAKLIVFEMITKYSFDRKFEFMTFYKRSSFWVHSLIWAKKIFHRTYEQPLTPCQSYNLENSRQTIIEREVCRASSWITCGLACLCIKFFFRYNPRLL